MPGAELLIARYRERAAGVTAGRTPDRARAYERPAHKPLTDHASGLRAACETLTSDLRGYVAERMVTK